MKLLDKTSAMIVGALSRYDPRNISAISKEVGLPNSTTAFRIKKLIKNLDLEVNARVDFNKIGLTRAIVFVETLPAKWNRLWNILNNLRCLTYITKCHGKFQGCYIILALPPQDKKLLEDYFNELCNLNILHHYLLFWTTNLSEVHPNCKWYDFDKKKWLFHWKHWIKEINLASDLLPEQLADPKEYPILADKKDLLLLSQLEKNGLLSFKELGKTINMKPRTVAYRYKKHLTDRKLIVDHMVWFLPHFCKISDAFVFAIEFENCKALAKFANAADETPFILSYAKVIGSNVLIVNTYLPKTEFSAFIDSLNLLAENRLIKEYFNVALTLDPHRRGGVPHELFENGVWKFNFEKELESLKGLD
jgi:DNA-binding Lrp family transcriptional regulator